MLLSRPQPHLHSRLLRLRGCSGAVPLLHGKARCPRRTSSSCSFGSGSKRGADDVNGGFKAGKVGAAPQGRLQLLTRSEAETGALAAALARRVAVGDVLCLRGSVGTGKTAFCRHLVQAVAGDGDAIVPSPTFVLQNVYDTHAGPPVHHFDLYRLQPAASFDRLGLPASFMEAVSLIEWPERLGSLLPCDRLDIEIEALNAAQLAVAGLNSARVGGCGGESKEIANEDGGGVAPDWRPRIITLVAHGARWQEVLAALRVEMKTPQSSPPTPQRQADAVAMGLEDDRDHQEKQQHKPTGSHG
eukprot:SM000232S07947  [mRNA]  locus=s232:144890:146578:- [translate_table: standard]